MQHGYENGRRTIRNIEVLLKTEQIDIDKADQLIRAAVDENGLTINDLQNILSPDLIRALGKHVREKNAKKIAASRAADRRAARRDAEDDAKMREHNQKKHN